jgi:hypothetical protein
MAKHQPRAAGRGEPTPVEDQMAVAAGSLADTVAAVPEGFLVIVRNADDVPAINKLLKAANKQCPVQVNERIGPQSIWRRQ